MVLSTFLPLALTGLVGMAQAATNDEWAARSIYQVVTDRFARTNLSEESCANIENYCGGTYVGLIDKLDYIQGMGFTAIQISPVQKNIPNETIYGEAYHGYWPMDLYSLNENFGTADELTNLTTQIHDRGMYLLVDVVANEMAYDIGDANMTSTTYIDYSIYTPFDSADYYDPYCPIVDWDNVTQYQNCWLGYEGVATPHLLTQDSNVTTILNAWIKDLISNYSIDGIRIDGAKQIDYAFFDDFISSAGVYAMNEVDDSDPYSTCYYQNLSAIGLENYPAYYTILDAFTDGDMPALVSMLEEIKGNCTAGIQYLANFIENQDNERFASYTEDIELAKNAAAYTLLGDGIPKMYYGQEQHLTGVSSPDNRQPLWTTGYNTSAPIYIMTAALNKVRNHAIATNSNYVTNNSILLYTDNSTYVTRKGPDGVQIVTVLTNQGTAEGDYELSVSGAADVGTNLTEVLTCDTLLAGDNGTIVVPMAAGVPRVYFPTFNLNGSGLCGTEDTSGTNITSTSTSTSSSSSSTSTKTSAAEQMKTPVWFTLGLIGVLSLFVL